MPLPFHWATSPGRISCTAVKISSDNPNAADGNTLTSKQPPMQSARLQSWPAASDNSELHNTPKHTREFDPPLFGEALLGYRLCHDFLCLVGLCSVRLYRTIRKVVALLWLPRNHNICAPAPRTPIRSSKVSARTVPLVVGNAFS